MDQPVCMRFDLTGSLNWEIIQRHTSRIFGIDQSVAFYGGSERKRSMNSLDWYAPGYRLLPFACHVIAMCMFRCRLLERLLHESIERLLHESKRSSKSHLDIDPYCFRVAHDVAVTQPINLTEKNGKVKNMCQNQTIWLFGRCNWRLCSMHSPVTVSPENMICSFFFVWVWVGLFGSFGKPLQLRLVPERWCNRINFDNWKTIEIETRDVAEKEGVSLLCCRSMIVGRSNWQPFSIIPRYLPVSCGAYCSISQLRSRES